jgi:hypothetical protein
MELLDWTRTEETDLRKLVEHMRQVAALVEMIGLVLERSPDEYNEETARGLLLDAGRLLEALGAQAQAIQTGQVTPGSPGRALKAPGRRAPKRRAA